MEATSATSATTRTFADSLGSSNPSRAPPKYADITGFRLLSRCWLPTEQGTTVDYRLYGTSPSSPLWSVCVYGEVAGRRDVPTRLHDACFTSEVLGSAKCDCAAQLQLSRRALAARGGVLIYSPQEGRGIGLVHKVAAYALQEEAGLDTVDANLALGLPEEARNYGCVPAILADLGVRSLCLLTNNPFKVGALRRLGVDVSRTARVVAAERLSERCAAYLRTKARRMGHAVVVPPAATPPAAGECEECEADGAPPLSLPSGEGGGGSEGSGDGGGGGAAAERAAAAVRLIGMLRREVEAKAEAWPQPRPHVTLTYAQSLDGSIAGPLGAKGSRLLLSGPRSMTLTHLLRAHHDAILVRAIRTPRIASPHLTAWRFLTHARADPSTGGHRHVALRRSAAQRPTRQREEPDAGRARLDAASAARRARAALDGW